MTARSGSEPEVRFHRAGLRVSFGISTLLALGLVLRYGASAWPFVVCAACLFAAPRMASALGRQGLPVDWLLALAALNGVIVVPELALRLAGFQYESGIQFGYPRPIRMVAFEPDAALFWRLPSSDPDVNSLGFPGPEIEQPKPAGTFRILFLGDSCTFQGYPDQAGSILSRDPDPPVRVETVNLGVPGYSSHQGRVLAEEYAAAFDPDLAFVFYGWNDHWLAYGAVDAEKVVEPPTGVRATRIYRELQHLRLFQLGRRISGSGARAAPLPSVRVPLDRYRENLRGIRDVFAAIGVPVVFVTAPSVHRERGVPAYLVEMNFAPDARSVVRMHRRYVEATREVAAEDAATGLLDLAGQVANAEHRDALFLQDGIHFSDNGLRWVAEHFAAAARPYLDTSRVR